MNNYKPRNIGVEIITSLFVAICKGIKKLFMKIFFTLLIIALCCKAHSQKIATDAEKKAYLKTKDSLHKIKAQQQTDYWDSINNAGLAKYKAEIIKKYGKKTGTKIANGQIEIGYTKDMCEDAWGTADTERKDGIIESWWYRKYLTALTFKNGKLIKIVD